MKLLKFVRGGAIIHMCLAALCAFCDQAQSATIQENYGIFSVNFLTPTPVTGALPGFNPSLGTLDSVAFTFDSSAVLLQGTAMSTQIKISDSTGTLLKDITFPLMTGRDQQVEMGSFTVPVADLADFKSTGNVDLALTPFTACRGSAPTPSGCNGFSGGVNGQVTYTYTPTPEPSSLPLFVGGVTAILLAVLWHRSTHQ